MYLATTNNTKNCVNSSKQVLRLVLYKGEVCRLPRACQGLRVLSGRAWVTVDGKDITLNRGEQMAFAAPKDFALVSAIQNTSLIVEVWGDDCAYPQGLRLIPGQA